jgi:hypothetical protein
MNAHTLSFKPCLGQLFLHCNCEHVKLDNPFTKATALKPENKTRKQYCYYIASLVTGFLVNLPYFKSKDKFMI